jgi:hypothetical protein
MDFSAKPKPRAQQQLWVFRNREAFCCESRRTVAASREVLLGKQYLLHRAPK